METTTVAADMLDPDATAVHGESDLEVGFSPDPLTVDVTSGGDLAASRLVGCEGFVATAPDYEVDWNGSGFLRVFYEPETEADTTLIVNGPDGEWFCEDDSYGTMDPTIDFTSPQAGEYDIWVGTTSGDTVEGELTITDGGDVLPSGVTPTTAPGSSTTATSAATTTTDAPGTTDGSTTTDAPGTTSSSTTMGSTTTTWTFPTTTTFTVPPPTITITTTTTTLIPTTTTFTIPPTTIPGITTTTFTVPTIPNPFP